MTAKTATKKQTEIQSATVNRVIDKASKKVLGYLVKSDTQEGVWYQVTWNREEHRYECTCPATKPCKHERAVSEVVKARKEIEAAGQNTTAQPVATNEPVATPVISETRVAVATRATAGPPVSKPIIAKATKATTAPLGSNKVFSLMR